MNLTEVSHTHTFENMDDRVNLGVTGVFGLGMCPAGHSDCVPGSTVQVTVQIVKTDRTTDGNLNLTAKSHLHTLMKKGWSRAQRDVIATQMLTECDAGHTDCIIYLPRADTSEEIYIGALASGSTGRTPVVNLVKMTSHTHTVVSDITLTFDPQWYAIWGFDVCELGHSECHLTLIGLINSIADKSVTTSSGWI